MSELLHAEDIEPGTRIDLGEHRVTLEEVISFSRRWDPQDFHVEQEPGGHFGGLIASGIHSMAILQRLAVLQAYQHWAVLAGRRITDVQFLAPVRPGTTLHAWLQVEEVDLRQDGRALVRVTKGLEDGATTALTATHELYVFRRPPQIDVGV